MSIVDRDGKKIEPARPYHWSPLELLQQNACKRLHRDVAAVILRDVYRWKFQAIADALGITAGAAYRRTARGRATLQALAQNNP